MALKPKRGQIELVNRKIDCAHEVIFPDPVVQQLWGSAEGPSEGASHSNMDELVLATLAADNALVF